MSQPSPTGVVVPMITPLTSGGVCDLDAVTRQVDHLVAHGVDGIMVAGTTGESLALSKTIRCAVVEACCEAVAGRAWVMVGIGASCLEDVLEFSRHAHQSGADFVSLHPPPYFPMDEASLRRFFESVIEESVLPMSLYTIPSFAANIISPMLAEILSTHSNVVALKDSTGNADYRREVLMRCAGHGVAVLSGDEFSLVEAARDGVQGIVPSTANLHPGEFVRLWRLCCDEKWEEALALQHILNAPVAQVLANQGGWLGMIRWLKSSLAARGVCESHLASLFSSEPQNVAAQAH